MRKLVPFLALAAAACSTGQTQVPRGTPELSIEFTWTGVAPCTDISPKITVRDVPPGTRRFRVELVDVDSVVSRHGGGEVNAAPDGVIPEGALKSYHGPCPAQLPVEFELRVTALDAAGRVLAFGKDRQSYIPGQMHRPSRPTRR